MKGTAKAAELAAAVKTAQTIIGGGTIEALRYIRLTARAGALEVEATNMTQHMAVNCEAQLSDGVAVVDPGRLLTALQPINGEASISCSDGFMSISGKGSRSRLPLPPNAMWDAVERPIPESSFDVDGESLAAAFETVAPAIGDDPSRWFLHGAHLKWAGPDFIAEAADSILILARQITARKPTSWPNISIIAPPEFVATAVKLAKGGDASLSVTENRIILTTPKGWLASKLVAATYPNIDRAWDPKAAPVLRADRKSLLNVLRLAGQFAEANNNRERTAVLHEGDVLAAGPNGARFRASFECEYFKEQTYCFQPRYLIAGLSALTSETVDLTDGGSCTAITIQGDGARLCAIAQFDLPAWWQRERSREAA